MESEQRGKHLYHCGRTHMMISQRRWMLLGSSICIIVFALANTELFSSSRRDLSDEAKKARSLYNIYFDYPDWRAYWEDLFGEPKVYDGRGDQSMLPHEANNIGYFITLLSCPGDGYAYDVDTQLDPGHAFYDAAALLRYSITRHSNSAHSKYNATMYAIVHTSAIRCKSPNGDEYDRVKVLQDLGYFVTIQGPPIGLHQIQDPTVRNNIESDVGDRDLLRLRALSKTNHPIIVLVDFSTFMLQPIDEVYDDFLSNPDTSIAFSMDYPNNVPNTGSNAGVNMHWVIMKPNPDLFDSLVKGYTSTPYSLEFGWNNQGVRDFEGVLGLKGFLFHYFTRVPHEAGGVTFLDRCLYGNDNKDPHAVDENDEVVCKDPLHCEDCRATPFQDIKVIKMIYTCGEPWRCSWDDAWDETTRKVCEEFHREWFNTRLSFEESCWHNGPQSFRTGLFHPEIFMGFCTGPGILGYDRMIDDKAAPNVCDTDTQTTYKSGVLHTPDGFAQVLKLALTTGEVTGSITACVSGSITTNGEELKYGAVIDFGVTVNGILQGGIDATHVRRGPTGLTFGKFVVTGTNPTIGHMNQITATITIDADGLLSTSHDQVTISTTNVVPGMLQ